MKKERSKTILLVDDDPLIIRMYHQKFDAEGYRVVLAVNGEEALTMVKKEKPDIILLDLMMPKFNGVETLKFLKEDVRSKHIPVIILTNLGDNHEDYASAQRLGAIDYLVKSQVSLKDLSERVKRALETGK